jgi:glycosyltransferase involved in cell wall biosynthesis
VVARDAMAYGRPVVATAVGGLVDVTGVLVPPGEVARLREVLEQLLADPDWRAHLGAGASETAREQLAPDVAARALRAAYDATVSR